ncbi:MAG: universal stress protein [Deltaproteobacteria bacterium]|nr:universal stress protein [Deltaproteobacteria bacterium]
MHFKNVLVTTDFSDFSVEAFRVVLKQVSHEDGKITLLSVVSDWVVPPSMFEEIPLPERIDEYRKEILDSATERIGKLAAQHFAGRKIETKVILSIRSAAQEICDYARAQNCDVIIMASHGKGAVASAILGSVTQKVLGHAPCPVLVVPAHAGH